MFCGVLALGNEYMQALIADDVLEVRRDEGNANTAKTARLRIRGSI